MMLGTSCGKPPPTQPIELADQACCLEANDDLTAFKGCVLTRRECTKKRKWWMRGQVTCTAVDQARCAGERCCHYVGQYDASIGEPIPDWAPPGFAKPQAEQAPPAPAPAPAPQAAAQPEPTTVVVDVASDGEATIGTDPLTPEALKIRLCEVKKALPDTAVTVRAPADAPYAVIVPTLETIKACGIDRVKIEQTTD